MLCGVYTAAKDTARTPGSCAATEEAEQQCQAAGARLEAALDAVKDQLPAQLAQLYPTKLKPLALEAVAALEAFWEQPEISKERLLELAQGAAGRGCAYLRCACLCGWGMSGVGCK